MEGPAVAFGMPLEAEFPLPELGGGADPVGLPLRLRLCPPAGLESSAAAELPVWRGRLGDGEELTVARAGGRDLLFGYGERARFRYDAARELLLCAPVEPGDGAWRRVLLTRILPNVAIARGEEALHAAAVLGAAGVVAIVAPSGSGKTTLALELTRRGWSLFADDTVVLARRGDAIEAHPAGPFMNLAAAEPAPAGARHLGRFGDENWVALAAAATGPAAPAAIVFLARGPGGRPEVSPLERNPLTLAPFMLGLPDDEGRDGPRFALYADLVERTPLLRLAAGGDETPAALAEALEQALGRPARALVGGAA
jgi:hypothetical protein